MKPSFAFVLFIASWQLSFAQCDSSKFDLVTVTVVTDSFPKDIGLQLAANDNSRIYLNSASGTYTEPFKKYVHNFCAPKQQCLRLFLTDAKNDGLEYPGYIQIAINNKVIQSISFFEYAYFEYFNCGPGESCGTPIPVGEGKYTTDHNNQYYQFTPDKNGYYKISTCDSLNACDTKLWIYEECRTFNPQSNKFGTVLFNDNKAGCGKYAGLPKAILERNKPYLIRIGGDSCNAVPIKWEIHYAGEIVGCMDSMSCNYNYLATIPSNDCIPQNDTTCKGPDLIIVQKPIQRTFSMDRVDGNADPCLINEGCLNGFGMRDVIRFETEIQNIGDQDYFIGKPYGNPTQFTYDNCHQHYHYRGYAEYLLFDESGNRMPIGFKAGFCVLDDECADTSNMKYSCVNMGLSTHCVDYYEKELNCQWIDITYIPAGRYVFVARVNWDNSPDKLGRVESRTDNNWAQVCFELKRQADSVWFVLDTLTCPRYVDCKGIPYGANVRDCKGVCGGKTMQGDLNSSFSQDFDDVQKYINQAVNESGTPTACDDLNDDGRISITDAAMLASCLNYGKKHIHIGSSSYHNHCMFPQKILNEKDTVFFKIQNHNPIGRYFDIAMRNPYTSVNAYQFKLKNAEINRLLSLADTSMYNARPYFGIASHVVGSLSTLDSAIRKSPSYKPLLRVFYNNLATARVEIADLIDVLDRDAYGVVGIVEGEGVNIVRSRDITLMNLNVHVQPNPVNQEALLEFYNPEMDNFTLEIMDVNGQLISKTEKINSQEIRLSTEGMSSGMYYYRLSGFPGVASGKFIVQKN